LTASALSMPLAPAAIEQASDEMLVRAAREGQAAAFDALTSRYYGMVYAIAFSRLSDRDQAEDLAQEVFLRAYLLLGQLHAPAQFAAWLSRMARNLAIDWIRRGERASRLMPQVPIDDSHAQIPDRQTPSARDQAAGAEEDSALKRALARLAPEHREIVLLHYMEGMSTREIGERLGMHQSTVSRQMNRALQGLHGLLEPVLREGTERMRARPAAQARALGVTAGVAALPLALKAKLAAGAAEGLKNLAVSQMGAQLFSFISTGGIVMGKAQVITGVVVAAAVIAGGGIAYKKMSEDAKPVRPATPASAVAIADDKPLLFVREFPAGRRIVMRMENNLTNRVADAPGMPDMMKKAMEQQQRQVQDISLTMRELRPDGGKTFEMQTLAMEVHTQAAGMQMSYNSRDPKPTPTPVGAPPSPQQMGSDMLRAIYDSMVGKKIVFHLSPDNKVEKVEGFEEMMAGLANSFPPAMREMVKQTMDAMMSPEAMKDTYGQFTKFEDYPDTPVKVGDTWTRSRTMTIPVFGSTQMTTAYRFAGWQMVQNRQMALITYDSKFTSNQPGKVMMGMQFNAMQMDMAGNLYYDPEIGYMRTSDMNTKGTMDASLTLPNQKAPQSLKLQFDQRVTVTITEITDAATANSAPRKTSADVSFAAAAAVAEPRVLAALAPASR